MYDINYSGLERKAADEKAIADMRAYLTEKAWALLLHEAGKVEGFREAVLQTGDDARLLEKARHQFQSLNHAVGFCGVRGYPFHAFCRAYCPVAYRDWMEPEVKLDADGFPA